MPGISHIYKRRRFYLDEDSWQILAADVYDQRDQLWRVQEAHTIVFYDKLLMLPAMELVYDLNSGRYLAHTLNNEDEETCEVALDEAHFSPFRVEKHSRNEKS